MKPKVFLSCAYSKPDPETNTRVACEAFQKLFDDGRCVPFTALWGHFHIRFLSIGYDYDKWLDWCFEMLEGCQALLRLPGESSGADREVAIAKQLGIPVFYSVEELYKWIDSL